MFFYFFIFCDQFLLLKLDWLHERCQVFGSIEELRKYHAASSETIWSVTESGDDQIEEQL